jgi:hypothetical protein
MTMSLTMTKEEREAFLADVHVAVISVAEDGHGPLVVPIWYSYEPGGEVRIITGPGDRYIESTRDMVGSVLLRMGPERWLTVDYAKRRLGLRQ